MKSKHKSLIYLNIIFIIILIFVIYIIVINFEDEDHHEKRKIHDESAYPGLLILEFDNNTQMYTGIIGPIVDKNRTELDGVNLTLTINGHMFFSETNETGLAEFSIPYDIIKTTDLNQKYSIRAWKEGYGELLWETNIEIWEK